MCMSVGVDWAERRGEATSPELGVLYSTVSQNLCLGGLGLTGIDTAARGPSRGGPGRPKGDTSSKVESHPTLNSQSHPST